MKKPLTAETAETAEKNLKSISACSAVKQHIFIKVAGDILHRRRFDAETAEATFQEQRNAEEFLMSRFFVSSAFKRCNFYRLPVLRFEFPLIKLPRLKARGSASTEVD